MNWILISPGDHVSSIWDEKSLKERAIFQVA